MLQLFIAAVSTTKRPVYNAQNGRITVGLPHRCPERLTGPWQCRRWCFGRVQPCRQTPADDENIRSCHSPHLSPDYGRTLQQLVTIN